MFDILSSDSTGVGLGVYTGVGLGVYTGVGLGVYTGVGLGVYTGAAPHRAPTATRCVRFATTRLNIAFLLKLSMY